MSFPDKRRNACSYKKLLARGMFPCSSYRAPRFVMPPNHLRTRIVMGCYYLSLL